MNKNIKNKFVCVALLDNGEKVECDLVTDVDFCNKNGFPQGMFSKFKFIGEGVIYSVNGSVQNFTEKSYFYKRA